MFTGVQGRDPLGVIEGLNNIYFMTKTTIGGRTYILIPSTGTLSATLSHNFPSSTITQSIDLLDKIGYVCEVNCTMSIPYNINEIKPYIQYWSTDQSSKVVGCLSTHEGAQVSFVEQYDYNNVYMTVNNYIRVNAIGEGLTRVSNINGNISAGDLLCNSIDEGYARKQGTEYICSYTIGKALEDCEFNDEQCYSIGFNIGKLIACIYVWIESYISNIDILRIIPIYILKNGGLMQLVAYGAQDVYLNGNSNITFFTVQYRRYPNFSTELLDNCHNMIYLDYLDHNKKTPVIINKHIIGYNICPITQSKIKENELYMTCDICHCNYLKDSLDLWLENHNNCPNCRGNWTSKIIYKNVNEEIKNEHVMLHKKHLNEQKYVKQHNKKHGFRVKEKHIMNKPNYNKYSKSCQKSYYNR